MYKKVGEKEREFFGTDIHVSHLEHELGHAWNAEKDEYMIQDDGTLKKRVGTAEYVYSFSKREDGKIIQKRESIAGLMIEEGMNTIEEERTMAKYMGLPLDEMKRAYRDYNSPLVNSPYQGYISGTIEYMLQELCQEDFEHWRLFGDMESKANIENIMSKTKFWKEREQDILPDSNHPRSYTNKRAITSKMKSTEIQTFFKENEDIYFPDISQMTPLRKIENVLEQVYDMEPQKTLMSVDEYSEFLDYLGWEGYPLINQTADLIKEKELANVVGNVRLSEVNELVQETKEMVRQEEQVLEGKTEEKGENR